MRTERNFIRTYTGRRFWPLEPSLEEITIADIAHSLSMICRFNGATRLFYSVAQHSCHVADFCLRRDGVPAARYGLLHDGSEAYICDIARPVKQAPQMAWYRESEGGLQQLIYRRHGLVDPEPSIVKIADVALLHAELRDLVTGADPSHIEAAAGMDEIVPWLPAMAEAQFFTRFTTLFPEARS